MITGIGIDIVELERMQDNINHERFIKKVLTAKEQRHFYHLLTDKRRLEFLAGRFAAKEAFAKAAGTGIGRLGFQDMEVLPNEMGAPQMYVKGYEASHIFVSITHSDSFAVAQAVLEESNGEFQ